MEIINEALAGGCLDCGEPDWVVLEFHHRDPATRRFRIAHFYGRSEATLRAEIAKCDVICANCHKRRHHALQQEAAG